MKVLLNTFLIAILLVSCQDKEEVLVEHVSAPILTKVEINSNDFVYDNQFVHEIGEPFFYHVGFTANAKPKISFVLLQVNGDTSLTMVHEDPNGVFDAPEEYTARFNGYWDDLNTLVLDEPGGEYDYSNPYELKAGDKLEMIIYIGTDIADQTIFKTIDIFLE